jgi:hypothetical protein
MNHIKLSATTALMASVLLLQATTVSWAKPQTFLVDDKMNVVEFTSDAPIELIKGHTNNIRGKIQYDDSFVFDAKHPFNITFEVDLASFDTGIALRNDHMRDNFLETSKYPKAVFKAKKIVSDKKPPFKNGQVVTIKALRYSLCGAMRHCERGTPPLALTPEMIFWSRSALTRFARPIFKAGAIGSVVDSGGLGHCFINGHCGHFVSAGDSRLSRWGWNLCGG